MKKFDADEVYVCPKCKGDVNLISYQSSGQFKDKIRLRCGQCKYCWHLLPCDAKEEDDG